MASVRRELDRTLATLQLVLAGSGLLLLAATALVVPRVLRRELKPLQSLAAEAARIDAASLSARFATEGLPGELAPIAARLNELLARLEDSFERERRFSSDVAHEFRTPVAELRSLAELAIKLPDTRAPMPTMKRLRSRCIWSPSSHACWPWRGGNGADCRRNASA